MGGHACGDVASRIACDEIVSASVLSRLPDPRELVYRAIERAHAAVREVADRDESKRGMGTTCVVAFVRDGAAWLGHVGDSRAYLVRGGAVQQLTSDQTKVQALVDRGIITKEDARNHPDAGVLSQAVGQSREVTPHVTLDEDGIELRPGDTLLLCSDGAYDCLADVDILRLAQSGDAAQIAEQIVTEATERDGKDNATVVVARAKNRVYSNAGRSPGKTLRDDQLHVHDLRSARASSPPSPFPPEVAASAAGPKSAARPPSEKQAPPDFQLPPTARRRSVPRALVDEDADSRQPNQPAFPPTPSYVKSMPQAPAAPARKRIPGENISEIPALAVSFWGWATKKSLRIGIIFFVLVAIAMAALAYAFNAFDRSSGEQARELGQTTAVPTQEPVAAPMPPAATSVPPVAQPPAAPRPADAASEEKIVRELEATLQTLIFRNTVTQIRSLNVCPTDIQTRLEKLHVGIALKIVAEHVASDPEKGQRDKYKQRADALKDKCQSTKLGAVESRPPEALKLAPGFVVSVEVEGTKPN